MTIYVSTKLKTINSSDLVGDVQKKEISIFFLVLRKPL